MPLVVAAVLIVGVHLLTALAAWTGVGLLADDHFMVGLAKLRHDGVLTMDQAFRPAPVGDAAVALYRPFIDVAFWLEQPWFGIDAFGYHVTNSLLHCTTALVWFVLLRRWSGSAVVALAAALAFVGWPGHSETTHWIAARTNVMSICLVSLALLAHDGALRHAGSRRLAGLLLGAVLAVVAIGTKESAVLVVPVACAVSWLHADGQAGLAARTWRAGRTLLAMGALVAAWLGWRAHCLGTWGSGSNYGWKASRIDLAACVDWLRVLLAPAHTAYLPGWVAVGIGAVHAALLVLALVALRQPAVRRAALPAGVLLGLGYLAGIGLERLDPAALENVRYTYEPALGLCVLGALGLQALPARARLPVLVSLLALHAYALDANRQSWLRVSAVYARTHAEVVATARATQQPLRVFDAPGVHDGAFGYMNAPSEFLFWQQTAPPGTDLRGLVSSTLEWPSALAELARAAAAKQVPMPSYTVRWTDGALLPMTLDAQWPHEPWSGTTIGYARIARERPFVGTMLPVQVLVTTATPVRLGAVAEAQGRRRESAVVTVSAGAGVPVQLLLPLDDAWPAGAPVAVILRIEQGDRAQDHALGATVPADR